jgi:hypothetical protein
VEGVEGWKGWRGGRGGRGGGGGGVEGVDGWGGGQPDDAMLLLLCVAFLYISKNRIMIVWSSVRYFG